MPSNDVLAEIRTTSDMKYAIIASPKYGQNFALSAQSRKSVAHVICIKASPEGFCILDTWSRKYLSIDNMSVKQGTDKNKTGFSTSELHENLRLTPIQEVGEDSDDIMNFLNNVFLKGYADTTDFICAIENENSSRPDIVVAVTVQMMSWECLKSTLDIDLIRSKVSKSLKAYFPSDIWAEKSIPDLENWLSCGRPKAPTHMEVHDDWLGKKVGGIYSYTRSAPHLINTFSRKSVLPSKKACLVATARNEGIYLLEWVSYHKAIGFEQIIIYSNDNTDGSDQLLSALADAGEIVWINNRTIQGGNAQENAYAHALTYLPYTLDYEWTMFLDLDEFLAVNPALFSSLADFLSWHSQRDGVAIGVNWQFIGPSSQLFKSEGPITRRMNATIGSANTHVKSFVKTRFAISQQPHFPRFDERSIPSFILADGSLHDWNRLDQNQETAPALELSPSTTHAVVYHYFLKSRDEFIWKFSRNRGNHPVRKGISFSISEQFLKSFISHFDRNEGDNIEIMAAMAPDLENDIQKLRRNQKILSAESYVIANYANSIIDIREKFNEFILEKWPGTAKTFIALSSR